MFDRRVVPKTPVPMAWEGMRPEVKAMRNAAGSYLTTAVSLDPFLSLVRMHYYCTPGTWRMSGGKFFSALSGVCDYDARCKTL